MGRKSKRSRQRKIFSWILVAVLAVLILTIRLYEEIGPDRKPTDRFIVNKVIDGDTVELLGGDKLRLLSIDTPERGDPLYEEARSFLSNLTLGRTAEIRFANRRRDRYGRLLGYLYIDSLFVNRAILENGLGYLYLFKDTDLHRSETGQLLAAQRRAMTARVGLWSLPREPEDYYLASPNSFRLHRPGCGSLNGRPESNYRRFSTREEGLFEGLSPCRNCCP